MTAAATAKVVSAGVGTPGSVRTVLRTSRVYIVRTRGYAPGLKTWERNHTYNNEDNNYCIMEKFDTTLFGFGVL